MSYAYEIAKTATEIDATLTREGKTINLSHIILSATALYYKLTLVTKNIKHFKRIPNLNIEIY